MVLAVSVQCKYLLLSGKASFARLALSPKGNNTTTGTPQSAFLGHKLEFATQ